MPSDHVHRTARDRRRIAIEAMSKHLSSSDASSATCRLRRLLTAPDSARPVVISGDVDGLVSAAMLASVAPSWQVVAIVSSKSATVLLHPSVRDRRPRDIFGLDVFSPNFDNVSNHVVLWGQKRLQKPAILAAFQTWDATIRAAESETLLAVPGLWASTEAGYTGADRPCSAKYKYPLGTAQLLLAMLEAAGLPPRLYDRRYLPWLIANCDGGVQSYAPHAYNVDLWWSTLAASVGPASVTEQIYNRVATMRPLEFTNAVNQLERERGDSDPILDDRWNLVDERPSTIAAFLDWLCDLAGWHDPIRGGSQALDTWRVVEIPTEQNVKVVHGARGDAAHQAALAADIRRAASEAINANFYFSARDGDRFNWVGGW